MAEKKKPKTKSEKIAEAAETAAALLGGTGELLGSVGGAPGGAQFSPAMVPDIRGNLALPVPRTAGRQAAGPALPFPQDFAQAGPRPSAVQPGAMSTGVEFATKAGRNAAIVTGAIKSVGDFTRQWRQGKDEEARVKSQNQMRVFMGLMASGNQEAAAEMLDNKAFQKTLETAYGEAFAVDFFGTGKKKDLSPSEQGIVDAMTDAEKQARIKDQKEQQAKRIFNLIRPTPQADLSAAVAGASAGAVRGGQVSGAELMLGPGMGSLPRDKRQAGAEIAAQLRVGPVLMATMGHDEKMAMVRHGQTMEALSAQFDNAKQMQTAGFKWQMDFLQREHGFALERSDADAQAVKDRMKELQGDAQRHESFLTKMRYGLEKDMRLALLEESKANEDWKASAKTADDSRKRYEAIISSHDKEIVSLDRQVAAFEGIGIIGKLFTDIDEDVIESMKQRRRVLIERKDLYIQLLSGFATPTPAPAAGQPGAAGAGLTPEQFEEARKQAAAAAKQ